MQVKNNTMIITITDEQVSTTTEIVGDCDVYQVRDTIKGLLVAHGYHPTSVDDAFSEPGESWFPDRDNQERKEEKINEDV